MCRTLPGPVIFMYAFRLSFLVVVVFFRVRLFPYRITLAKTNLHFRCYLANRLPHRVNDSPGISVRSLDKIASLICCFYLIVSRALFKFELFARVVLGTDSWFY